VQDLQFSDNSTFVPASGQPGILSFIGAAAGSLDNWSGGNLHPIAQLDTEQDWSQNQHIAAGASLTIGPTNPVAGALTANALYVNPVISQSANPAATGTVRMATGDSIAWRDNTNTSDVLLSKTGGPSGNLPANLLQVIVGSGFLASAYISSSSNPAASGDLRLASSDLINWRNNANSGDISLSKNTSDVLLYNNLQVALTIAAGTVAMPTAAIAGGACSSSATGTVTVGAAANLSTTDVVTFSFSAGLPGINPGELTIPATIASAGTAPTFEYCNETGAPVTPPAQTLNWRVVR
jgi:hypothetical protein